MHSSSTIDTCGDRHRTASVQAKWGEEKKEKPLFLKVLDSVIPPASESAREYVEPTQKKKKEKPKQSLDDWEDELLGGL